MAIRQIAKMGHPVLRRIAAEVPDPTALEIARLAADMRETLEHIGATGIAATQVFVEKRVVVYHIPADRIPADATWGPVPWTTMVNPVLTPTTEEKQLVWERCLSIPGLHGQVSRHARVTARYQTLEGEQVEIEASGTWATLLQHECDHLDGMLFPARMSNMDTLAYNEAPGALADDIAIRGSEIDPRFHAIVSAWPDRERWTDTS
jgi:peptide deformylase